MASTTRPTQEAIETFTGITGASEEVAVQKLEEYGGNLNEAVNAYFNVGYRHNTNPTAGVAPSHNTMDMNSQISPVRNRFLQILNAARNFNPSSLLNPNYRRNLLNEIGASAFASNPPHTGAVMGVPLESNSGNVQPHYPGMRPSAYDEYRSLPAPGSEILENPSSMHYDQHPYHNEVEEEMIRAAIEASKQEESHGDLEDDQFAHALSMSLKTAEEEKAMREHRDQHAGAGNLAVPRNMNDSNCRYGNSSVQVGAEDIQAQSPVSVLSKHASRNQPRPTIDASTSNEWGGISSKELDEAVMLEAALFGVAPESTSRGSVHEPDTQRYPDRSLGQGSLPVPSSSSSTRTDQQLLREQQDNEYFASLIADREKEMNASKEAQLLCLKEDESRKELLEEEKLERWLATKETSLPKEPALDDEKTVALLVKMPDGSRRGRRFLKSDKLQFLFDFIDVSRAVKPGTYRVVRPYPRHAFSVSDGQLSLEQLGLTSKQEALFLEFI